MLIQGVPWGAAFTFTVPLVTKGVSDYLQTPTLATGDVKLKKDLGGSPTDLGTLPTAPGDYTVEVSLSATEMEVGEAVIRFIDQTAPKEWEDQMVVVQTELKQGALAGTVVTAAGANTAIAFKTNLTGGDDDYKYRLLVINTGALAGQVREVAGFATSTDIITVNAAFPSIPADGVKFVLSNR